MERTDSVGRGINSSGLVVGYNFNSVSPQLHDAFISDGTPGKMPTLGVLGGTYSEATSISNLGNVVGPSTNLAGQSRAFISDGTPGGLIDLGTLGGDRR